MITEVDEQLLAEAEQFRLRHGCEACAHFDPEHHACGNGFPTEPHRAIELDRARSLAFCKDFELA